MFEILPNPSLEIILIAGRALFLIGAFWVFALAFIRWRRADERSTERLYAQLERAFDEMRSLHETVAVMSARLEALSERAETGARLAPAGPIGAQRSYDLAQRLAKSGSDIEALIESCGLTRYEAELLTRLHGKNREQQDYSKPSPEKAKSWRASDTGMSSAGTTGRKKGSLLSVVG
ncbi:MAG: DUF2802 domain-containing protein [Gammaproteobacteria bacterium]|nr:hypothetical protein [Gammaproteobacteria bacterium]